MRSTFFTAVLSMSAFLCARAAGPSSTPTAFTCPAVDGGGFSLGTSDVTSDPIFCSYPATPNEDPNDFFCTYSRTTGILVQDHDAGLCPPSAPAAWDEGRRRSLRAPLPTRPQNSVRGVPDNSNPKKSYIKKRRVSAEQPL